MAYADRLIDVFSEAKARPAGDDRDRFLAEIGRAEPELMRQIVSLLQASDGAGQFLARPFESPTVLSSERPGDVIGPYKLREILGEGGCGVVYVAEQDKPVRRMVALKVIKLGMDTKAVVARFEAERQALAVMDHPNIAKVLEAGATETGRPYFVMELVRGTRITEYCDRNHLSTGERIQLFAQVCQAIQHAHQKGIIHRDIKPSNILVTLHDGVPVPKVIDFGIAKATEGRLTDATVYTHLHQFIGTPAYMSPEQAEMSGLDIDTRSDIYSLGVLLYELLVGSTPFDGKELVSSGIDAMRQTIREKEAIRPSTRLAGLRGEELTTTARRRGLEAPKLIHLVRGDLDWIVMKCLEKDRKRRYETANGLAADLRRYLDNEPIVARPPSPFYRLQKAFRRNKLAFAAGAAIAVSLIAGLLASFWQTLEARRAQRATQRQLYVAKMNLAQQAWDVNNIGRVKALLDETSTAPDRGFEWYYWQRQIHSDLRTLRGHLGPVVDVSFSPKGERIVTASYDHTARIWDANHGTMLVKLTGHRRGVTSASWSPDGRRILTASEDKTAAIWDAASGAELRRLRGHAGRLTWARFSPDGQQVVTGSHDRTARVWRVSDGQQVFSLPHGDVICSVVFSSDGTQILTADRDEIAIVWDASTGEELFQIDAPSARIAVRPNDSTAFAAQFSPDGKTIMTVSQNQTANFWDAATGDWLFELKGSAHWLSPRQSDLPLAAGFSPNGDQLITGGLDFAASVWRVADRTNLFTLKGHEAEIVSAAFSPDGHRIVTGSYDHTAKIWDAAGSTASMAVGSHSKIVPGVAFSPNGEQIVSVSLDGTAQVCQASTGKPMHTLNHGTDGIWGVAFSDDGARIVTGTQRGHQGGFRVWDAFTGGELLTVLGHAGEVYTVHFSRDGTRILTGAADGTAKLWDASNGQRLRTFEHNQPFVLAAFSPDGQRIVTVCNDNNRNTLESATAAVWDADTGQALFSLEGQHLNGYSAVAYAPNGRYIVTGSVDWTATVWDADTGKRKLTLSGHRDQVIHLAISPDSKRIFTGGFDHTTRVWDANTGEELLTLSGGLIAAPGISRDGRRIATGPHPPAIVWEAASPEQVEHWHKEAQTAAARVAAERRARAVRRQVKDAAGIKQWLVLHAIKFDGSGVAALDQEWVPDEALLRPREGEDALPGPERRVWTAVRQDEVRLNFRQLAGTVTEETDYCVSYAVGYIVSETSQRVNLLVGSDDHAKIYLNGQEVYRHIGLRGWEPDEDEVPDVPLEAGINVLVFKVVNEWGPWDGSVRFTAGTGQTVKGVQVTLSPDRR